MLQNFGWSILLKWLMEQFDHVVLLRVCRPCHAMCAGDHGWQGRGVVLCVVSCYVCRWSWLTGTAMLCRAMCSVMLCVQVIMVDWDWDAVSCYVCRWSWLTGQGRGVVLCVVLCYVCRWSWLTGTETPCRALATSWRSRDGTAVLTTRASCSSACCSEVSH